MRHRAACSASPVSSRTSAAPSVRPTVAASRAAWSCASPASRRGPRRAARRRLRQADVVARQVRQLEQLRRERLDRERARRSAAPGPRRRPRCRRRSRARAAASRGRSHEAHGGARDDARRCPPCPPGRARRRRRAPAAASRGHSRRRAAATAAAQRRMSASCLATRAARPAAELARRQRPGRIGTAGRRVLGRDASRTRLPSERMTSSAEHVLGRRAPGHRVRRRRRCCRPCRRACSGCVSRGPGRRAGRAVPRGALRSSRTTPGSTVAVPAPRGRCATIRSRWRVETTTPGPDGVAGDARASAAHRERHAGLSAGGHDLRQLVDVGGFHDEPRQDPVERGVRGVQGPLAEVGADPLAEAGAQLRRHHLDGRRAGHIHVHRSRRSSSSDPVEVMPRFGDTAAP